MLRPDALADFVALLGFVAALVLLVLWQRGVGARSRGPYLTLAAAMTLMAFVSFSNILEHVELTSAFDRY